MPHLHMIRWPDSGFGIQLPKEFLEQIGVQENDEWRFSVRRAGP